MSTDMDNRQRRDKCPCFHAGESPNVNDDVDLSNCCSGGAGADGKTCGCISDGTKDLPEGADKSDCCSGKLTEDGKHCVASTCEVRGTEIRGGQHCCSDHNVTDEVYGVTRCLGIVSGDPLPEGATHMDCYSNAVTDDGKKCAFLDTGSPVPTGIPDARKGQVCYSRSVYYGASAGQAYCRCIPAGHEASDGKQCCSGALDNGKCTCIGTASPLVNGGTQASCCTGVSDPATGACRCAPAGAPIPGENATQCCAERAGVNGKYCGCVLPNTGEKYKPIAPQMGVHCCGGAFNFIKETGQCQCIPKGYGLGIWVPKEACCSGERDGNNNCK